MNDCLEKKNAKPKGEGVFSLGFAFLVMISVIVVLSSTTLKAVYTAKTYDERARRGIYEAMEEEMSKCARIGVKMEYAGADIEKTLLPELKVYLYSLSAMTRAFSEAFGEEKLPVRMQYISKISGAAERLSRDYSAGYPAKEAEKALCECLKELGEILEKWNFE